MLDINAQEVLAAEVAGHFASRNNERRVEQIDMIGSGMKMFSDVQGTHFSFPVNINREDRTRVGDIIVIIFFGEVVGCFLR